MTKKLSNLERIKLAWNWGYGAIVDIGGLECQIIMVSQRFPAIAYKTPADNIIALPSNCFEDAKLLGYRYLGELGGNAEIPVGTRFRVKGEDNPYAGEIWEFQSGGSVWAQVRKENYDHSTISTLIGYTEIEPYFDD